MKNKLRLSSLCLALISVSFLTIPINSFAQPIHSNHSYDNGYDDGYDDGYEDAMDDCPCPPGGSLLGGFYAGLGVGYEGFQIQRKPWILEDRFGTLNTHANGWNGKLFGGYGHYFNRYYLGGEVFLGTSGASGRDTIDTPNFKYTGNVSVGTSWGASLLPGYKLSENGPLVYARLGYVQTDFKVSDWSNTLGYSSSRWVGGLNTGIGVEVPLYKSFSARLEYDYINYNSFSLNGNNIGSKNSASDNRGSLDLMYHFDKKGW